MTRGMEEGLRLNHVAVKERLQKLAEKAGGKLIAHKLYSNHPEDSYLYVVLVEIVGVPHMKFVTWLANLDNGCGGSFNEGHYFEDFDLNVSSVMFQDGFSYEQYMLDKREAVKKRALKDFIERSSDCYRRIL